MKHVNALMPILHWSQCGLFACAFLLLGYCGFVLVDVSIFQRRESRDLDRQLRIRRAARASTPQLGFAVFPKVAPAGAINAPIGRVAIPRLLLSAVVVEGVGRTTLRRAVGHIPGTVLPGQAGNVGLAGHRDTFFRALKDLRIKDEIQFSTLQGDFTYEVESLRIVEPNDARVLAPSQENALTMVTCYPFYYVGPAPQRFVVPADGAAINCGMMKRRKVVLSERECN